MFTLLFSLALLALGTAQSGSCTPSEIGSEPWLTDEPADIDEPAALSLVQLDIAHAGAKSNVKVAGDSIIDKIVFIKLHCVGSSTMTSILHHYCLFHQKNCFVYPVLEGRKVGRTVDGMELQSILEHFQTPGVPPLDIFPNHVVMQSNIFDALIPKHFTVALFRGPLDRVMSGFRHGPVQDVYDTMQQLQQNVFTDFCGNATAPMMSEQILPEQVDELDYVLLLEEYDLSIAMLRKVLGWSMFDMVYLKMKSTHPPEVVSATAEFQEYLTRPFAELNGATQKYLKHCVGGDETVVYDKALRKFTRQWDSLTDDEHGQIVSDAQRLIHTRSLLEQCCSANPADGYCTVLAEDNEAWNEKRQAQGVEYGSVQLDQPLDSPPAATESSCMSLVIGSLE